MHAYGGWAATHGELKGSTRDWGGLWQSEKMHIHSKHAVFLRLQLLIARQECGSLRMTGQLREHALGAW